jgi:hypothetical protein
MTFQITTAEIDAGLTMLESAEFKTTMSEIKAAWAARFGDISADEIAVEDVLALLGKIPGLSVLGELSTAIKAVVILSQFAQSPPNGGILGAFFDSVNGVVRPVDNPGGAVTEGEV